MFSSEFYLFFFFRFRPQGEVDSIQLFDVKAENFLNEITFMRELKKNEMFFYFKKALENVFGVVYFQINQGRIALDIDLFMHLKM